MTTRLIITFALILVGTFLGLLIGYFVYGSTTLEPIYSDRTSLWALLTASGAFGGLLYTIREKGLELPRRESSVIKLGWLADAAYGIGGAYIVFLLIPGTMDLATPFEFIKVIGTATVGGYGGRSLVDRALADVLRRQELTEESVQSMKEHVESTQRATQEPLELVYRQLEPESPSIPYEELKQAIEVASFSTRAEIFEAARLVRRDNWRSNKEVMELSIPVFEALVEFDTEEAYHRNHGQLGFALKDKREPEWERAEAELSKAIEIRNRVGEQHSWLFYEFNRAICRIRTDIDFEQGQPSKPVTRKTILGDLKVAALADDIAKLVITESPIAAWLQLNNVSSEEVIPK